MEVRGVVGRVTHLHQQAVKGNGKRGDITGF